MKKIILFTVFTILAFSSFAQYSAMGLKGGLTVGIQNWSGIQRQPMLSYHADFTYEKFNTDKFSYLVHVGYHARGSAIRYNNLFIPGVPDPISITLIDRFDNLSFMLGAKNLVDTKLASGDIYYFLGVRGDYTVNDTMATVANMSNFINAINYGITVGGGYQFKVSDKLQLYIDLSFHPDFSYQLRSPAASYFTNINGNTILQSFSENKVTNLTLELSVGIKFFRY